MASLAVHFCFRALPLFHCVLTTPLWTLSRPFFFVSSRALYSATCAMQRSHFLKRAAAMWCRRLLSIFEAVLEHSLWWHGRDDYCNKIEQTSRSMRLNAAADDMTTIKIFYLIFERPSQWIFEEFWQANVTSLLPLAGVYSQMMLTDLLFVKALSTRSFSVHTATVVRCLIDSYTCATGQIYVSLWSQNEHCWWLYCYPAAAPNTQNVFAVNTLAPIPRPNTESDAKSERSSDPDSDSSEGETSEHDVGAVHCESVSEGAGCNIATCSVFAEHEIAEACEAPTVS